MTRPPPFWWSKRRRLDTVSATRSSEGRPRWWVGAGLALVRRPNLWSTAAHQALRLAPSGWWRRWPPLPRPDRSYLRFRMETAYGDADHAPEPADVVSYLAWCRQDRRKCRPWRGRGG